MKRILAFVLALAMMLPALGMAEAADAIGNAFDAGRRVEMTLNAVLGEALVGAETSALVDSLSLLVTAQKEPEQIGLALCRGENVLASLELEACGDSLCLRSNLLGERAILISADELEPLTRRVMQYAVGSGLMTQQAADEAIAHMEAALAEESSAVEPADGQPPALTDEQQKQLIAALTSLDFMPALEEILALAAKVEVIDRNIPQPGTDKAVMLIQGSFTGEDVRLLAQAVVRTLESSDGLVALLADAGFPLSDEGFQSALNDLLNQAEAAVKSLDFSVYLGEDGGVVHFSSMPVFEINGNLLTGSISYRRDTMADSMRYTLDVGAGMQRAAGEYTALFGAELVRETRADGSRYTFSMDELELTATTYRTTQALNGGEYSEWVLRGEMLLSGESVGTAQIQAGSFVSGLEEELPTTAQSLSLSLNDDAPCATLLIQAQALAENAASFAGESAVELMAMTDEEFSAFMDGVLDSVKTWATDVAGMLPGAAE